MELLDHNIIDSEQEQNMGSDTTLTIMSLTKGCFHPLMNWISIKTLEK